MGISASARSASAGVRRIEVRHRQQLGFTVGQPGRSSGGDCSERLVALPPKPDFDEQPNKGLTCVEPGWPQQ